MRRPPGDRLRGRTAKDKKRRPVCAIHIVLAVLPRAVTRSLSLAFPRSSSVIPLLFQRRCPSDTLAQPTTLPLSLSPSQPPFPSPSLPSRVPLAPSSLSSRSPFSLSPSHRGRLARARDPCTSAFLSAERRTGFRRKETTIRRIVATDHSWRVDRINGVN